MFKYLKLLAKWKDVTKTYAEENQGKEKPWYISRRFFGVAVAFIGLALFVFLGVAIPDTILVGIADNVTSIITAIKSMIPACISLYGSITSIIGMIKKSKEEPK